MSEEKELFEDMQEETISEADTEEVVEETDTQENTTEETADAAEEETAEKKGLFGKERSCIAFKAKYMEEA